MKRFTSIVFLLLFLSFSLSTFLVPHAEAAENSWTTKASMPTARTHLGVAVVNGKIYAIGGYSTDRFAFLAVNEEYDPAINKWTTKALMPTPRSSCAVAVCKNMIYVIGGQITGYGFTTVNEAYNPATDTWTKKEPIPASEACSFSANVVDDKIYLIRGKLNLVYDTTTNSWAAKTPVPIAVYNHASAVVDDKIYVMSGFGFDNAGPGQTQIYDPKTDRWSSGAPIPIGVEQPAAGATTGSRAPKAIYVIGGSTEFFVPGSKFVQVYFPKTNSWRMGASMPTARASLGVAVVNDMLYAIGGTNSRTPGPGNRLLYAGLTNNELYTPIGYGTPDPTYQPPDYVPPKISVWSPQNDSFFTEDFPLTFTVNEPVSWIGYSLDGKANVTIAGNTTLTELSKGTHNLVVYASDTAGNTGTSETVHFNIKSESFPTLTVAAIVIVAVAGAILLAYFTKVKKTTGKVEK